MHFATSASTPVPHSAIGILLDPVVIGLQITDRVRRIA
jgi:hypothetical protein